MEVQNTHMFLLGPSHRICLVTFGVICWKLFFSYISSSSRSLPENECCRNGYFSGFTGSFNILRDYCQMQPLILSDKEILLAFHWLPWRAFHPQCVISIKISTRYCVKMWVMWIISLEIVQMKIDHHESMTVKFLYPVSCNIEMGPSLVGSSFNCEDHDSFERW